jgi:hypothetical protein
MAKTKEPAAHKKATAPATKRQAVPPTPLGPKTLMRKGAPPAPVEPEKQSHFDERRPDAPATRVATHARQLAKQVRADAGELKHAKVTPFDAERLELFADTLSAAEEAWLARKDQRDPGGVADTRDPLRDGRDQVFAALRTFARRNPDTQAALDRIGDVQGDDDLVNDAVRLLALAKKHRVDLDGTDLTDERLADIRRSLIRFTAARAGERAAKAPSHPESDAESAEPASAQIEDQTSRMARRARNRAFWLLAELDRDVVARGQYAFRRDAVRQAKYRTYRRSEAAGSTHEESPAKPETK